MIYYGSARLGLLLAFAETNASPVWPPSGFAFAAILLLGHRVLPGIVTGAFAANLVVFLANQATGPAAAAGISISIAVGNTLEAVTGAFLIRRWVGLESPVGSARNLFKFVGATLLMCLVSSAIGATSLGIGGIAPWPIFTAIWFTWWLGDVAGVLILTPVLLTWFGTQNRREIGFSVQAVSLFAALVVICQLTFGRWLPASMLNSQVYLLIPFLLWAAFRFSPRVATSAVLLVSGLSVWATVTGTGPFFIPDALNQSLLLLQSFVCVIAVTMLSLVAVLTERQRSQASLAEHAVALEKRSQDLSELNVALARSNKELENFSYVVSHDLKAPLRGISSLAGWLQQDYAEVLDEEGRENLGLLVGRVTRMDNLIEGVLAYSRIGRSETRLVACNSARIVGDVVDSLTVPEGLSVAIEGNFPTLVYDETHLVQLFQNLIQNAITHFGKPEGEIAVSCREVGANWEFCVRDTGVGIPVEHLDRIFKVFQTLKPRDEIESTGIGLSVVQKIAEWHGGSVTVQSTVGEGSAFAFTVPKSLQPELPSPAPPLTSQ